MRGWVQAIGCPQGDRQTNGDASRIGQQGWVMQETRGRHNRERQFS